MLGVIFSQGLLWQPITSPILCPHTVQWCFRKENYLGRDRKAIMRLNRTHARPYHLLRTMALLQRNTLNFLCTLLKTKTLGKITTLNYCFPSNWTLGNFFSFWWIKRHRSEESRLSLKERKFKLVTFSLSCMSPLLLPANIKFRVCAHICQWRPYNFREMPK